MLINRYVMSSFAMKTNNHIQYLHSQYVTIIFYFTEYHAKTKYKPKPVTCEKWDTPLFY